MSNNLPSINLVKNKQVPLFDKFMNWTLTVGRLIVIMTEVVAVAAFVYRFSLDERLIDLHSAIKQKQNIISALKNDEDKYRNLQDRIAIASAFSEKATRDNLSIASIINLIPSQIKIDNLTWNKDRMKIDVDVVSISSLADFIDSLKNYPNTKAVSIDSLENKPLVGLSADITAVLK